MDVKMLEDFKYEDPKTGFQILKVGEQRTVNDARGQLLCNMGVAEDVSGSYPTTPKDTNKDYSIQPDKVVSDQSAA